MSVHPLFARHVVPIDSQRRPCIFCGRPTAYLRRAGLDVFAHSVPSCPQFAGVLEQLANHAPQRDRFYACKHVAAGAEMDAYLLLDPGPVHSFVGVRMCAECRDAVPALLEASEQIAPQLVPQEASAAAARLEQLANHVQQASDEEETLESALGPWTEQELRGQPCVCGHHEHEHGPVWCRALACECRNYRSAEGAS